MQQKDMIKQRHVPPDQVWLSLSTKRSIRSDGARHLESRHTQHDFGSNERVKNQVKKKNPQRLCSEVS